MDEGHLDDRPDRAGRPGDRQQTDESLWAVHISGPDDVLAMPNRTAAERYATQVNDMYQSAVLGGADFPRIHASVVASPWDELSHWKNCAEVQSDWVQELESQLHATVRGMRPRAYLVPDDETMANAWLGPDRDPSEAVPREIRNYTMKLLAALPARPSAKETASNNMADTVRGAIAAVLTTADAGRGRSLRPRSPTMLAPAHLREVMDVLVKDGWVRLEPVTPESLAEDEQCRKDFFTAQMAGTFRKDVPVEIWCAAYAAALNRCSSNLTIES